MLYWIAAPSSHFGFGAALTTDSGSPCKASLQEWWGGLSPQPPKGGGLTCSHPDILMGEVTGGLSKPPGSCCDPGGSQEVVPCLWSVQSSHRTWPGHKCHVNIRCWCWAAAGAILLPSGPAPPTELPGPVQPGSEAGSSPLLGQWLAYPQNPVFVTARCFGFSAVWALGDWTQLSTGACSCPGVLTDGRKGRRGDSVCWVVEGQGLQK